MDKCLFKKQNKIVLTIITMNPIISAGREKLMIKYIDTINASPGITYPIITLVWFPNCFWYSNLITERIEGKYWIKEANTTNETKNR